MPYSSPYCVLYCSVQYCSQYIISFTRTVISVLYCRVYNTRVKTPLAIRSSLPFLTPESCVPLPAFSNTQHDTQHLYILAIRYGLTRLLRTRPQRTRLRRHVHLSNRDFISSRWRCCCSPSASLSALGSRSPRWLSRPQHTAAPATALARHCSDRSRSSLCIRRRSQLPLMERAALDAFVGIVAEGARPVRPLLGRRNATNADETLRLASADPKLSIGPRELLGQFRKVAREVLDRGRWEG